MFLVSLLFMTERVVASYNLPDPYTSIIGNGPSITNDTTPLQDRNGNWIEDPTGNPFDLLDPEDVVKTVTYDPVTNTYILTETIGGENYRAPTSMTFEEYMEWNTSQEESAYWKKLAGAADGDRSKSGNLDPVAQVDVSDDIIDRLFGGTTVDIRPQGNVDLSFGLDYYRQDNPILPLRQQRNGPRFDFDMDIQVDVNGKIGEKLNTSFNYNTSRTFDFQNKLKLDYNSDLFSEDEILKSIEAGNVSLPLKSTLIKGSQSLFGIKTELQFGHLRLTAIASQQNSKQNNIQIQGGSVLQEFSIYADQYDENRHFFISHYNRNTYEAGLKNLPQINSLFKITRLEVWVTNDRNQTTDVRDVVAFADLGEWERMNTDNPDKWRNPDTIPLLDICMTDILPDNSTNFIMSELRKYPELRDLNNTVKGLQEAPFNFVAPRDFEKIQGRKLNPSEYRFNPDLGFISLNIRLDQDEVIGVAYEYTYNGKVYQVGELSQNIENVDTSGTQKVLYVKMLKSSNQNVKFPLWDLMMKNVYRIGGGDLNGEEFEFDIFYEDPGLGFKRFLPAPANVENVPLLNVFGLDKLNITGDPQPDGKFDFVAGITINPPLGIIMFPVLEPFGTTVNKVIVDNGGDPTKFVYQQLYDSTIVKAREFPELNRYTLRGKAKSSTSSDISLGAFNIPPGSVRVTAGGQTLRENEDYIIDYNIGRIKILNQAYLQPSTPINVSFEDNALFSFNRKTMLGFRADYEVSKKLTVGGTYLHMYERPFTQKVNIGDDPINNRIYGLDMNYSDEQPWLTRLVDKIPGINTNAPSNVTFEAEMAALRPSHSRAIDVNKKDGEGVVYLDDFEGTSSNFDLRTPTTAWFIASTPQNAVIDGQRVFPEADSINSLVNGANRAHINWYRIDDGARGVSEGANQDPYTRLVTQQEIFENRTPSFGLNDFRTFDVHYVPDERGPYNFDLPGTGYPGISQGLDPQTCKLNAPDTRWGGIMRALNQTNFEQANIEALEFWILDPFLQSDMGTDGGKLVFQLGNISEDILRDSRKFFEHGLPLNPNDGPVDTTVWAQVPRIPATVNAFSNAGGAREIQDVGLDGFTDDGERIIFKDYLDALQSTGASADCIIKANQDPANDNFVYFLDEDVYPDGTNLYERYSRFNGQQGNSPPPKDNDNNVSASSNYPDTEDINNDNTMSENESYYEYVVQFDKNPIGPGLNPFNPLITDIVETENGQWYRFRIPLAEYNRSVNGISDFRSIRFMRMFMTNFNQPTTLRFATFDLVRNQWRRVTRNDVVCGGDGAPEMFIDAVNIEEHSDRLPFRYDIPLGIQREQITSTTYQDVYQNEQSLSIRYESLNDGCELQVFKNLDLDLRVFKNLQMFVHSEEKSLLNPQDQIPDKAVKLFIRLGSDFTNNYYEYEVPLYQSRDPLLMDDAYKEELWKTQNEVKFSLEDLTNLKIERNESGTPVTDLYEKPVTVIIDGVEVERIFRIIGNPTLGYVRNVSIGIRNATGDEFTSAYSGEVWVNELRMVGLEERGGVAALARLDADLADFGSLGLATTYSSIGFGALDQKLDDRAKESVTQFDFSTNLQLGKFFGQNSKVQIPFYYQYSETSRKPQFDQLDLDLPLKEKLARIPDQMAKDSVREQNIDFTSLKQISVTNVRVTDGGGGKPMPWDVSNLSASYAYSRSFARNEVVEKDQMDQHRASLDYAYSINAKPIEPFKNLSKSVWLKWLTELNLNPVPSSFTFGTVMDRKFGERSYRFSDPIFKTWFDKRFTWIRTYSLRWDLSRSIKLNFNAANSAVVDEPNEYVDRQDLELIDPKVRRDSIWDNIFRGGRTKDYNHTFRATFAVPLKSIPLVDWIRLDLSYDASYSWKAAALNTDSLGNVIQNGQTSAISTEFDFTKLYNKSPFLAKINKPAGSGSANRGGRTPANQPSKPSTDPAKPDPADKDKNTGKAKDDKKKSTEINPAAKVALRMVMMIRKWRINYGEVNGTTIPGFTPSPSLLGMSSGFGAPGLSFVSGIQPKINRREDQKTGDFLADAKSSQWITTNAFQNAPVLQFKTKNLDSRLSVEPFTDFKVDFDFARSYNTSFNVFFKTYSKTGNTNDDIDRRSPREIGSFTMSYLAIPTLFTNDSLELNELFDDFETNRALVSAQRGVGVHEVDGSDYTYGFGRKQQDILLPAFLAAYTDKDAENFEFTDIFDWIPRPNWTLNYSGLTKLGFLKNTFSNIRLTHGYKSTLTINNFASDLNYDDYDDDTQTNVGQQNPANLDTINRNYYSQFLMPSILIEESFAPLIGIDVKMKNDMNFSFNYSKRRGLAMGFVSYELAETRSTTVDFGFDWKLKNIRLGFLPGFNSAANKKKPSNSSRQGSGGTAKLGNDLSILFDLSFSDNFTFNHLLDQDAGARATRGSKDITISPAISYDVNKNVALRFFFDYRRQEPYVSTSFIVVNWEGGLTVRIKLE
jgi:cell surface protein SprA